MGKHVAHFKPRPPEHYLLTEVEREAIAARVAGLKYRTHHKKVSVMLAPKDIEQVKAYQTDNAITTFSGAHRQILREVREQE